MRILHTSDWHLGQKFINQGREAEHEGALDWLLQTIADKQVDALIVAGDIFDVSNPPVSAEEQYYSFLTRLKNTGCRHVVITGGNHDSPSKLNAPRGLLRALDVHVVGCTAADPADELIELRHADGRPAALVVAVPFLRDKDFKYTIPGETLNARVKRIQLGLQHHYARAAELARERLEALDERVPVIATGHLYAKGALANPEQANIYIGNLENVEPDEFPEVFDYVALGHIHRAQRVGKKGHVRYSGSLIPLSFSEVEDVKSVVLAELEAGQGLTGLRELEVPTFRRLITLRGPLEEVEEKIRECHQPGDLLPAWVEAVVESDYALSGLDRRLRECAQDLYLDLLKIRNERRFTTFEEADEIEQLTDLTVEDVFRKRCAGKEKAEADQLLQTFRDLREWVAEHPDKLR
jgi:exonuclease SbcD